MASNTGDKATYPDEHYPTDGPDSEQNLVNQIKNDYLSWWRYTTSPRVKWENYWKSWNNTRTYQQYYGDSNSFEPVTVQLVETTVDNVYGNRPKMSFMPRNRYQEADPKRLNLYWDYTWDENDMDKKIVPFGRENTIIGNSASFQEWDGDHMGIKHIPFEDCFFDPSSPDPQDGRYAGYRRLVMLDTLKEATRYDPETEEWVPRYKNLDQIKTSWTKSGEVTDREFKDMYQGSTFSLAGEKAKQVEVLYICYLDRIVELANRHLVIFDEPSMYHKAASTKMVQDREDEENQKLYNENSLPEGAEAMAPEDLEASLQPVMKEITIPAIKPFLPVAVQRDLVDPALPLARGTVDLIYNLQEDLNDAINEKKDNLAYSVKAVGALDPAAGEEVDNMAMAKPGDIIPVAPAHFAWIPVANMSQAADEEIARIKQSMHDTARISGILNGQIPAGVRTAVEINSMISIASAGFKVKTQGLASQYYTTLGRQFIWMMQIFADDKIDIPAIDAETGPQVFDPEPYWGDWNVKVQLESDANVEKTQQGQQAMEMRQSMLGDPNIDQKELDKLALQRGFDLDEDEVSELMPPGGDPAQQMQPGMMPPGAPMGAPGQAPPPAVLPTKPTMMPMQGRPTGKPNA